MATVKETKTTKQKTGFATERKKPLSGKQMRTEVDQAWFKEQGLRPYWALDRPGRINEMMEAGYRFVSGKDYAERVAVGITERDGAIAIDAAGRDRHTGEPLKLYLMAIPVELYEESLKEKRKERDERMSQIKTGSRSDLEEQVDTSDRIRIQRTEGQFT